jgi:hypothetical protein
MDEEALWRVAGGAGCVASVGRDGGSEENRWNLFM